MRSTNGAGRCQFLYLTIGHHPSPPSLVTSALRGSSAAVNAHRALGTGQNRRLVVPLIATSTPQPTGGHTGLNPVNPTDRRPFRSIHSCAPALALTRKALWRGQSTRSIQKHGRTSTVAAGMYIPAWCDRVPASRRHLTNAAQVFRTADQTASCKLYHRAPSNGFPRKVQQETRLFSCPAKRQAPDLPAGRVSPHGK
jgi:hypothetical protein